MTVLVSRAVVDDWERMRALRLSALADTPDAFGSTLAEEIEQPEPFWRGRLANAAVTTLLATLDGVDAGIIVVAPDADAPADGWIYAVWVAPFARGRGVGDAIVEAAIAEARARGFARLRLEVGEANPAAQALYARHGFVATGKRGHLPPPREHMPELELARVL